MSEPTEHFKKIRSKVCSIRRELDKMEADEHIKQDALLWVAHNNLNNSIEALEQAMKDYVGSKFV